MSTDRIAEILTLIGAIGLVQFASLAFSVHQLQVVATGRLRRKMSNPMVRHATPCAALFAVLLLASLLLRM